MYFGVLAGISANFRPDIVSCQYVTNFSYRLDYGPKIDQFSAYDINTGGNRQPVHSDDPNLNFVVCFFVLQKIVKNDCIQIVLPMG